MKTITPVSVWTDGGLKQATILNAYAVNVSLNDSATFVYFLISEDLKNLSSGNLVMDGQDYQDWEQDIFAWDWIAEKLGVTITGDYVQN
jgi:hypothetical protein